MNLRGQHVVVIGGSSGIGLAVAKAVIQDGGRVTIAGRDPDRLAGARRALGREASVHSFDARNEQEMAELFEAAEPFEHLVYTAGDDILQQQLAETDVDAARRFFDVRFWGAAMAIKHGAPLITPSGSITLTSSTLNIKPAPGLSVGAAVVAAIEGLARSAAVELAPIRVNTVSAGVVRTPLWDRIPAEHREAFFAAHGAGLPAGRIGDPSEIADGFLFFMRSAYATGQTLVIDGGHLLT